MNKVTKDFETFCDKLLSDYLVKNKVISDSIVKANNSSDMIKSVSLYKEKIEVYSKFEADFSTKVNQKSNEILRECSIENKDILLAEFKRIASNILKKAQG